MSTSFYDSEKNMVSGVLAYVCVQTPVNKYESQEKEWKVSVIVDEDTADEFSEKHQKQPAKAIPNVKFKELYKIDPPFDGKKQYVITLKKDVLLANGQPVPEQYQPKIFTVGKSGKLVDVTRSKLVGNGSEGVVSIDVYENKYGCFARLQNVKVDTLIEYEDRSGVSGSEFGEVDSSGDEFGATVETPVVKTKAPTKPKKAVSVADLEDDDAPF